MLAAHGWIVRPVRAVAVAETGMDVLRAYRCRRGETKQIVVRGVEDSHSPAGVEPNFIRPGRQFADTQTFFAGGSYDQVEPDRRLTDSFQASARTAHGVLLIRQKSVADNSTDTIAIGDLSALAMSAEQAGRFSEALSNLPAHNGWTRQGELYFVGLEAVPVKRLDDHGALVAGGSLLDLIRRGANGGWVDVMIQDDTSVDFLGVALCLEPATDNGLTLAPLAGQPLPSGVIGVTCGMNSKDQAICDPYAGDTPCFTRLPLACIRPDGKGAPASLRGAYVRGLWSGGQLAFTEPVAGGSFSTFRDADARCAARFGLQWRTARLHDGTGNGGIVGYSAAAAPAGRVWIDMVGSPHATCWAR